MKQIEINSSKQALALSKGLPSYWSQETLLSQRLLIYIARLLEDNIALNQKLLRRQTKRKLTPWQLHTRQVIKRGGTMQGHREQTMPDICAARLGQG